MKGGRWLASASAIAAGVALALAGLYPGNNPDTFGHLAQGRQIAELGHVPKLDTWSLLPGPPRPWINYEWLSDLGTWSLYATFGYDAVTYFKALLLLATGLCLGATAFLIAGTRATVLTSFVLVSTIPAIRVRLSDRPHVLGIAFAAAYLLAFVLLQRAQLARRHRYAITAALVVLHLVWVNAHGSHLLGIAIGGSFLVLGSAEARRSTASALGLQLLASCVSPYGPAIWVDALAHVFDARYRALITEWLPWQPHDPPWQQLGPALQGALLAIGLPRTLRQRATWPLLLISAVLGCSCFRSVRFASEFMLLSAPLAGIGLAALAEALSERTFALVSAGLAGCLTTLIPYAASWTTLWLPLRVGASFRALPIASGRLLKNYGAAPRVFASMQDSWFLMFAAPNSRFVLDGRTPFYGPEHILRYAYALADVRVLAALQRDERFNTIVVRHTVAGESQVSAMLNDDWALVMIEDAQATFVTPGALNADGVRRYPRFEALHPNYDLDWIYAADASDTARMRSELARLQNEAGSSGYRSWVEALLLLAPLRRGTPEDGFRWPRSDADWKLYRRAHSLVAEAARNAPQVPVVAAIHAQLAAVLCDLEAAHQALEVSLGDRMWRVPMMIALDIALREGRVEEVKQVVATTRTKSGADSDPWLAELADGVERPPTCH